MVQTRSQTKKQKEDEDMELLGEWSRKFKERYCSLSLEDAMDKAREDGLLVDTNCDRCGHEDIEWCMSNGCRDEEEELDAWCYSCGENFSADTEQGGDDGTEEEEWVCNSCFKDINNSSRIVEYK